MFESSDSSVTPRKNKYALVVGVNAPSDRRSFTLSPLLYAESDAEGLRWPLERDECSFAVSTLIGEDASVDRVIDTLLHLNSKKSEEDLLLFYFIGHGYPVLTDEGNHEVFLVTSDFNPTWAPIHPDRYISLRRVQKLLIDAKNSTNVVIILDCCFAGYIFENAPGRQLLEAFQQIVRGIQGEKNQLRQANQCKAIIASTGANAFEEHGHVCMTGVILDALGGRDVLRGNDPLTGENLLATDSDGNITIGGLCTYLHRRTAQWQEGRRPITEWSGYDFTLARYPVENPIPTRADSFLSVSPLVQPSFDNTTSPMVFAHMDIKQVKDFLRGERVRLQEDYRADLDEREQLQEFGWLQEDHPSYGALLCFGKRPTLQIAGAYTRCTYWNNERRSGTPIDFRQYRGSLLQQFTQACEFLQNNLNLDDGENSEQPKIPFRALKEALANALIHREYVTGTGTSRAEEVVVEILSDRIEIRSPGGPPPHVSLASLQNAQEKHPGSHPRNPQIMRIFYLAGHAEHVGTGIERMQWFIQEAGLQQPKFDFDSDTQTLIVTLSRRAQQPALPDGEAPSPPPHLPKNTSQSDKINNLPVPIYLAHLPSFLQGYSIWTLLSIILIAGIVIGSTGVVAISRVVQAFTPTTTLPPPSTTIEIASLFPTSSGSQTLGGQELSYGVQMAVDDTNNNNLLTSRYTLKLSTTSNDIGSTNRPDPQIGASNIKEAIADNLVAGVIGPQDISVVLAGLPLTNQSPIAQLSPNISYPCLTISATDDPDCTGVYNIQPPVRSTDQLTFFRLATTDDRQGKATADYFFKTMHYQNVLLLKDDSDAYNFSLALPFQREWQLLGGSVVSLDLPLQGSSIQTYQHKLKAMATGPDQADLIYVASHNPNGTNMLQALSTINPQKTVLFAEANSIMDNDFLQAVAQLRRSPLIYASLPIQDPAHAGTSKGIDFQLNYIANGHYTNYSPLVASAYDCTMMLVQAIKAALQQVSTPHGVQDHEGAVHFRKTVLQALAHLSYKEGATGRHSFDADGDTTNHTISFYQLDFPLSSTHTRPDWAWRYQSST